MQKNQEKWRSTPAIDSQLMHVPALHDKTLLLCVKQLLIDCRLCVCVCVCVWRVGGGGAEELSQ